DQTGRKTNSLIEFNNLLPEAERFGPDGFNQVYIRSGWSSDDTFISFRAGDSFTQHGHYDAGHFTLFKGAPLAINSSVYGKFTGPNRLDYSIRTIAKNSLLILRPGEIVHPNRKFTENVSDGGQRVTLPTGSDIISVKDWLNKKEHGPHLEGGHIETFEYKNSDFAYVAADLTRAYNSTVYDDNSEGGKVKSVKRELVYLFDEDRLIVHDTIESTNKAYIKKWLLHSVSKPQVDDLTVLKGTIDNGIMQSHATKAVISNQKGHLTVQCIYPADAVIRMVGGKDYQYYVEVDGDERDLDGKNFSEGAISKPWFDIGMWRIEIQSEASSSNSEFLVSLAPGLNEVRRDDLQKLIVQGKAKAVASRDSIVLFTDNNTNGAVNFTMPDRQKNIYIVGMRENIPITISINKIPQDKIYSHKGITKYELAKIEAKERRKIDISW
ncbi:MAG: hypothetical protein PVJ72_10450, partial [Gammaproteobacteria bacterium]